MVRAKDLVGFSVVLVGLLLLMALVATQAVAAEPMPARSGTAGVNAEAGTGRFDEPVEQTSPPGDRFPAPVAAQPAAGIPIHDDLVITQSVTLQPGVYNVEDVNEDGLIIIDGDDVTLEGTGVYINGLDYGGYGIVTNGHARLTLRSFDIKGFFYGVRMQGALDVLIEDSNISGN